MNQRDNNLTLRQGKHRRSYGLKAVYRRPKLVLVSAGIRRDLHQPLRYFRKLRVFHLYAQAAYQDMKRSDFYNPRAVKFNGSFDLYRKISQIKPDILQTAEPWANRLSFQISLVCLWYRFFHRVKLVFPVFENRPLREKFSLPIFWLMQTWVKILSFYCDRIFYLNQGAKKNLLSSGVEASKLRRLAWGIWGINLTEFCPGKLTARQKFKRQKLVFVGKVSRAKGLPWLLKAFQLAKKRLPRLTLTIAGLAEEPALLAEAKWLKVEFVGTIKNQDLAKFFQAASVVIAPSVTTRAWEEQVGMVNLQALACSTPVISTRSGAIPEYIQSGQGCLLVAEKDASALAGAIEKFLTDEKFYIEQAQRARRWVNQHYEVRRNIFQIEKELLGLVNQK